jgi:hypothetical protein
MRLTLVTARLTRPGFFAAFRLAAFFAAFFAGLALRAFTALAERAVFLAGLFDDRFAAFFAFLAAFFLATRLAI